MNSHADDPCGPRPTHDDTLEPTHPGDAAGHPLERYASIVDDLDALIETSRRPLPRAVWINTLLTPPEPIAAAVLQRCPDARPVPGVPHAFRLPAGTSPGTWPEFALGLLHAQEQATLWPADLVGAQPGERVLDLCAAPGNKTLRLAVAMRDSGTIVANERYHARLPALRHNLERLGVTSVAVVDGDGCSLPDELGPFDRALVDVPCTCEGTGRKTGGRLRATSTRERDMMSSIQTGLLRRALRLVRPGGTVVYATCTYAPEENEGVLDRISPELATIEPIDVPDGMRTAPGVPEWQGQRYRDDVAHAVRIWAHHNDTGGFFVARLRRL